MATTTCPPSRAALLLALAVCASREVAGALLGGAAGVPSSTPPSAAGRDPDDASLDPTDWSALRRNAHELLDASIDRLEAAREGRVWTPCPDDLKQSLESALPEHGVPPEELTERLAALLPYGVGNTHPRFFGWVHGAGSPGGVLPELVGAAMNANCGGRDHAAMYVEKQVLAWCREMMGFPADSGALLVSGTSMATVIALKAARDKATGFAMRAKGVHNAGGGGGGGQLVGYTSAQAHSCVARAFDLLGLGTEALRKVPVHADDFTMDMEALAALVAADKAAGLSPFVVIGTAGSVNVGAIDDLQALADFARDESLWLHVDGAFGAPAVLSEVVKPRLAGLGRADSLAFDFHKWLQVNYDAGCVLIRDRDAHLRSFSERPDYLAPHERGLAAGSPWPVDFGPELSRGFRALKVWSHILEHGTAKLGSVITRNCEHATHLAALVDAAEELERLAPASLNIVVFRYTGPGPGPGPEEHPPLSPEALDDLNNEIVVRLQESGVAAPSTTKIGGKLAVRVNITNHRTRFADLDLLVAEVQRLGAELLPRFLA